MSSHYHSYFSQNSHYHSCYFGLQLFDSLPYIRVRMKAVLCILYFCVRRISFTENENFRARNILVVAFIRLSSSAVCLLSKIDPRHFRCFVTINRWPFNFVQISFSFFETVNMRICSYCSFCRDGAIFYTYFFQIIYSLQLFFFCNTLCFLNCNYVFIFPPLLVFCNPTV